MILSELEFGWLCGLLEGEGSFGFYNATQRVSVEMTDVDTMNRYCNLISRICDKEFQVTEFQRPHRINRENHSVMYRVQVTGENARSVMKFVVYNMGARRRAKIWQSLNRYTPKKASLVDVLKSIREPVPERMSA